MAVSRTSLAALAFAAILLPPPAAAQGEAGADRLAEASRRIGHLMKEGKLEDAENLLKEVLPSPLSEPKKKPGELNMSVYGMGWGLLVATYIAREDYTNAERVAAERVAAAEQAASVGGRLGEDAR